MNTHRLYYQNLDDCETMRIVTPDEDYELISELNGEYPADPWNTRTYRVRLSNNCCPEDVIKVAVQYDFVASPNLCMYNDQTDIVDYTFDITGINPAFISRLELVTPLGRVQLAYNPITQGIRVTRSFNVTTALFPNTDEIILTHVDGYEYTLNLVIDYAGNDFCDYSTDLTVDYPELDPRINVQDDNGVDYILMSDLFTDFTTGVYQVIISREYASGGVSVQNHVFANCNLICEVIQKLVECRDSDVMTFYDALVMSNYCTTVYNDICSIYELLLLKLNNPGCYDPFKDCNCNDSIPGTSYSYRQSNSHYKSTPKRCGTCTS